MANTERVSDQIKRIKDAFDNSNHSFMASLVSGLRLEVIQASPDLDTVPSGKTASVGKINLNLVGSQVVGDANQLKKTDKNIRQLMDSLKNESAINELLS
jgi:hypothetical protein